MNNRPKIVCLCGSTRFPDAWKKAHREESLKGNIVLSVGVMIQAGDTPIREDGPQKQALDELHLRKIDLADEVLILNVGGYIGESTKREFDYAVSHGKFVRMLEGGLTYNDPAKTSPSIFTTGETADELAKISHLLHTQDNRITDQPVFIVQKKVRDWGLADGYTDNFAWLDSNNEFWEADEKQARILDKMYERGKDMGGWRKVGYRDRWEFVTACFTEKGCEDYIRRNGHNLGENRIYADASWRNHEYQVVRNFLLGLTQELHPEPKPELPQGPIL